MLTSWKSVRSLDYRRRIRARSDDLRMRPHRHCAGGDQRAACDEAQRALRHLVHTAMTGGMPSFALVPFPRRAGCFFHRNQHTAYAAEYQPIVVFIHDFGLLAIRSIRSHGPRTSHNIELSRRKAESRRVNRCRGSAGRAIRLHSARSESRNDDPDLLEDATYSGSRKCRQYLRQRGEYYLALYLNNH